MAYFRFEDSYQTEITSVYKGIQALNNVLEASKDSKLHKSINEAISALTDKVNEIFADITPSDEGIKHLDVIDNPNCWGTPNPTKYEYHCSGLFKGPDGEIILEPFDFIPPLPEIVEENIDINYDMMFATNEILANNNRSYWHRKSEETVKTIIPTNFSYLLYNYMMYIANGSKSRATEISLVKLKESIAKFKEQLNSRSLDDYKALFTKFEKDCKEAIDLDEKSQKYYKLWYDMYSKNNYTETPESEANNKKYNLYRKESKSLRKTLLKTAKIILKEIDLCKKYEQKVTRAIGFNLDTTLGQAMYNDSRAYANGDISLNIKDKCKQSDNQDEFTKPMKVLMPYRYAASSYTLLKHRDNNGKPVFPPEQYINTHVTGNSTPKIITSYIEEPVLHIPYLSKDQILSILDNYGQNIIKEKEILENKPKDDNKYGHYKPDPELEIAYYASIVTKDFINEKAAPSIVADTDVLKMIFTDDVSSEFKINDGTDEPTHYRFCERTSMYKPDIIDDKWTDGLADSEINAMLGFIRNYETVSKHMIKMLDECTDALTTMQKYLASIDDEDFHNYLVKIKMIEA